MPTTFAGGGVEPGGRGRRQVSLTQARHRAAAIVELGVDLAWSGRANLLVLGGDLRQALGRPFRIGTALIEITQQCDPCSRLEALAPGLKAALTPAGRGGVLAPVIEGGSVAVGDEIGLADVAGE